MSKIRQTNRKLENGKGQLCDTPGDDIVHSQAIRSTICYYANAKIKIQIPPKSRAFGIPTCLPVSSTPLLFVPLCCNHPD
jgi:hypothetical protein